MFQRISVLVHLRIPGHWFISCRRSRSIHSLSQVSFGMERRSVHDQQTLAVPTQPNNTRQGGAARDQQNAATAAELGPPQGPPQLPPQMFTTAAQLLDLTDSMFSFTYGRFEKISMNI
jgi:hypothetical protein